MAKCITLEHPDGSIETRGGLGAVTLVSFLFEARGHDRERVSRAAAMALITEASAEEIEAARDLALQWIMENLVPVQNAGAVARIEDVAFPAVKDEFRPAWRRGDGVIEVDMEKAREIHMDRIRVARDAALIDADNDVKKAEDAGDATALAQARTDRQALRDIPQTFDLEAAKTPDELKALWPEQLTEKRSLVEARDVRS